MREPISKKLRFEVFKRDKFTCQYCGAKAPDVVLHCDHVHPVAEGGKSDTLNLVAACQGCNSGKGRRLLDDSSVIERQRDQLEALEARREQLAMMLEWRNEFERVKTDTVQAIANQIASRGGFGVNENGKVTIRKWLKRFSFDEIVTAVDESFDSYMKWTGDEPNEAAWNVAFGKIPGVCSIRRQMVEKPYLHKLIYVQGILRNRLRDKWGKYISAMETMVVEWGADVELLEDAAKEAADWNDFCRIVSTAIRTQSEVAING